MVMKKTLHHSTRFPTDIGRRKSKISTNCWSGKILSNYRSEKLVYNNELSVGIVSSFCVKRSVGNVCIPTDGRLLPRPMRAQLENYRQYLASPPRPAGGAKTSANIWPSARDPIISLPHPH
jgi:hypothetical protein